MIYKDCIHYEACKDIYYPMSTYDEEAKAFDESDSCDGCQFYSDKSRFVELPCKVGDVVYQVTRNFISEFRVRFVEIATCGNLFLHTDLISGIIYTGDVFSESDIGKTVFLTREEAEKALKEREKNERDTF